MEKDAVKINTIENMLMQLPQFKKLEEENNIANSTKKNLNLFF